MKKFLLVILLMTSSACWAQKPAPQKHDSTYTVVDHMPQFPGGDTALNNFLKKNIHYPENAAGAGIEGTVYVSFVINGDGSIDNVSLLRDIGGGCGDEAVRVVKLMPKWKPGKQNGNAVSVKYYLPIKFQLSPRQVTSGIVIYK